MDGLLNLNKEAKDSKKNDQNSAHAKQAQNIWSMLDEMATTNPESYK